MSNPLMNFVQQKQSANNNMMNLIKAIRNPKQFVCDTLNQRAQNNPQLQQMIKMAQNNNVTELKKMAKQMYKGDFDKDYDTLMKLVKR